MIRNPIDAAVYASPQLSEFIKMRVNDPDLDHPLTLDQVRDYLADLLSASFTEAELMHHFDDGASLLDELDALIEEYGPDALADDFSQARASEPLSRVIEAVMSDENREYPPTLEEVQEAMAAGLVTRLVGDGILDEDEDETLAAEMEALISRFGSDSLAEEFLRYE